ncbi:zinc knuckle CX2CX4HX4C containing protein [Tanacetum coccineum]
MEVGFLLGNNLAKKDGLASKVKNIEGKPLGKDGKPLKSCLKNVSSKTKQGKPAEDKCTQSKATQCVDHVSKTSSNLSSMKSTPAATASDTIQNVKDKDSLVLDGGNAGKTNATKHMQVTPKKVLVSVLTNEVNVLGANVAIPISVVDEIRDKFANTLYGYFVGEKLTFPIVETYVVNAWKMYGFERAIFYNGFFFFKFSSHDGMIKTLEGGPWFIRSIPIFLNEWSADTKMKKEVLTRVPVWVRIHNVLVVAFSETGLSLIATQLGRPIRLDACTNDMCLNPWGRNTYARILVKLNSENEVMESIVVAIPLPKGEGLGNT